MKKVKKSIIMAFVYNCCFWFSLRLGGILIGSFSFLQGILILAVLCWSYKNTDGVQDNINYLLNNVNMLFFRNFLHDLINDTEKYLNIGIVFTCIYLVFSIFYIYGAYKCKNFLMMGFLVLELSRLILLTILITTGLLLLKQNTMDIGILIGSSVACGFFLLGMFYLWVCAVNLPILITEMEQEEHTAAIAKLQKLLELNQEIIDRDNVPLGYATQYGFADRTISRRNQLINITSIH